MQDPVHPYTKSLMNAVPFPDLDRPLDFATAGESSATSSKAWASVFRDDNETDSLATLDLGDDHFVLARSTADFKELRP